MKNISELHENKKGISAKPFFKGALGGNTIAIQLLKNEILKEHSSKTDALLVCIKGKVFYKDEVKNEYELHPGNFVEINADVKHWLEASKDSQLLLLK